MVIVAKGEGIDVKRISIDLPIELIDGVDRLRKEWGLRRRGLVFERLLEVILSKDIDEEVIEYDRNELNQRSGGSFRVVINTKDWDNSFATNSPGQSGNPKSEFYKNLYEDWANDKFFPLLYSKNKILMNLRDRKVFKPLNQSE